jgi:hypothetical protein
MLTLKERRTEECQNKLQQLEQEKQGKVEDHVKDGKTRMKRNYI